MVSRGPHDRQAAHVDGGISGGRWQKADAGRPFYDVGRAHLGTKCLPCGDAQPFALRTPQCSYGLNNVEVIRLGIPLPAFDPSKPRANPSAPIVLTVGPLNMRKGAPTLLAAIPLVLARVPNATFWFAGGAEDHESAKRFRAEHPEATNVTFLGFVSVERLAELYEACSIYVSPAVYESFGLTFVEAMARAKPVIGCDAGAVPELVENEVNGLLVPPVDPFALADAVVRLLTNPEEQRRFGETGYRIAHEQYSDVKMAERVERYFETICVRPNHEPTSGSRKIG